MSTKAPFSSEKSDSKKQSILDKSYKVIVLMDPVNIINYVVYAFFKIFGYNHKKAQSHIKDMETKGYSVLWVGSRERAELYVYLLQEWQLNAYLRKDE